MQWQDNGILLQKKQHGEKHLLLSFFTREHGLQRGMVYHTKRTPLLPGNCFSLTWNARLAEHLGQFKTEQTSAITSLLLTSPAKLACLNSTLALLTTSLSENEQHSELYDNVLEFLQCLLTQTDWKHAYIDLELSLLATLGFGLDLHNCAATGTTTELVYVSPKSGKAVSRNAGLEYHNKMLTLPEFMRPGAATDHPVIADDFHHALNLTGYFLTRYYQEERRGKPPHAREHLLGMLR